MLKAWRSSALSSLVVLLALGGGTAMAQDRFNGKDGLHAAEEKALAQHYYETGKRLFDQMDYGRAYDNLRLSVEADPTNQAAVELYRTAGSLIGKRQEELDSAMDRMNQAHKVKIELVRQEMTRFYESGQKHFEAQEFDAAIRDLERAREMIQWYPYQVDNGQYRERADKLIAEAKHKKQQSDLDTTIQQQQRSMDKAAIEEERRVKEGERRIESMLEQTHDLIGARRYKEADELASRILVIEPQNIFAKKYKEYATLGIHTLTDQGIYQRDHDENTDNEINQHRVAISQENRVFKFPENWLERTADRKPGINPEATEEPFWVKNYRKILRERRVTLNFPDVPLQDVILFLQDITGLNFVIAQGVDATEKRISLRLKDIVLENALRIILEQTKLTYIFDRESIIICEPGAASGETYFEIYDVSDILYKVNDFQGGVMKLPNPSAPAGGGGGGGGNSLIFDDPSGKQEGSISIDVLIEIIKGSTGGDESWPSDGTSIEGHRGQLLVTNNRDVHAKIATVLENLRRNQGLFVHIETRFIDINNDMLEDVGVDFRGLGGNAGNPANNANSDTRIDPATGAPRPNSSNPFGTPVDSFSDVVGGADAISRWGGTDVGGARRDATLSARQGGATPGLNPESGTDNFVYRTQQVFGAAIGNNVLQGTRLVGGKGLTFMATQLDFWQLNTILHAEYQENRARRLTAPRVTAANRERVFTSVITQRAYIADWQLVSGGTGLTVVEVAKPVVLTFQEGVTLEVRPTVSSDRKFVTLDVRPALATLVGGRIKEVRVNLGSVTQAALNVPIQIPEITLEEAFTSITIPDGGTALLGGFRQISDTNQTTGIPILMDIPILGFFFKRQGQLRETRSLVILITANIVSIRDEEAKRYNRK